METEVVTTACVSVTRTRLWCQQTRQPSKNKTLSIGINYIFPLSDAYILKIPLASHRYFKESCMHQNKLERQAMREQNQ